MTCDYYKCSKTVREEDLTLKSGMKFCVEHGKQIDDLMNKIDSGEISIGALLGFWVEARGGAERLAKSMLGRWDD